MIHLFTWAWLSLAFPAGLLARIHVILVDCTPIPCYLWWQKPPFSLTFSLNAGEKQPTEDYMEHEIAQEWLFSRYLNFI